MNIYYIYMQIILHLRLWVIYITVTGDFIAFMVIYYIYGRILLHLRL